MRWPCKTAWSRRQEPDPECDLDYTPNTARKVELDYALSTNLGFGGHNACLALKKYNG